MSAIRILAPLMTAALATTALVGTGPSATATAAAADSASGRSALVQCLLRLQKTRVKDLQNDLGSDLVFAQIGNSRTISRPYTLPQTRNTLGDGSELFSNVAVIRLIEESGPFPVVIDTHAVTCEDATRDFVFSNGDAKYKVRALVQVQ